MLPLATSRIYRFSSSEVEIQEITFNCVQLENKKNQLHQLQNMTCFSQKVLSGKENTSILSSQPVYLKWLLIKKGQTCTSSPGRTGAGLSHYSTSNAVFLTTVLLTSVVFLYLKVKCKATSSSNFLFVVAVSGHFRAGSEAISIYIYKMYHFDNTGTEGIEEEQ